MELLSNIFLNIFGFILATFIFIVAYFKWCYTQWKNLGIEYLEPTFPFGSSAENLTQKTTTGKIFEDFYAKMRLKKVRHAGTYIFHRSIYMPIDLDLIKQIMQVDFAHFMDHGAYYNERSDPLSAHLFSLEGQRWRKLRNKLTPTFTSGKMKNMFPIMVTISEELIKVLGQNYERKPIEAKDISARFTTDIIGTCAFGIDCNSLLDPETEFRIKGKRLFDLTTLENVSNFMTFVLPNFTRLLGIRLFPKVATDFFWKVIKETTEYREKNNVRRNDAMQLLLDMKNQESGDSDMTLTFNELAAQAFGFFAAGFETSSTLMSFALMELAINEDVQETLRMEINSILKKNDGNFTYEGLAEMQYLDMVIYETLRKYPPIPLVSRICTKDYRIPGTDITLKKGQLAFIPIQGVHYDPEFYGNPQKFDPTRFNEENRSRRPNFAFLAFGEGPRTCIGLRFGMMQAKVGLTALIKNFKLRMNENTELPIKLDPTHFFTTALDGIWIDLEKVH